MADYGITTPEIKIPKVKLVLRVGPPEQVAIPVIPDLDKGAVEKLTGDDIANWENALKNSGQTLKANGDKLEQYKQILANSKLSQPQIEPKALPTTSSGSKRSWLETTLFSLGKTIGPLALSIGMATCLPASVPAIAVIGITSLAGAVLAGGLSYWEHSNKEGGLTSADKFMIGVDAVFGAMGGGILKGGFLLVKGIAKKTTNHAANWSARKLAEASAKSGITPSMSNIGNSAVQTVAENLVSKGFIHSLKEISGGLIRRIPNLPRKIVEKATEKVAKFLINVGKYCTKQVFFETLGKVTGIITHPVTQAFMLVGFSLAKISSYSSLFLSNLTMNFGYKNLIE